MRGPGFFFSGTHFVQKELLMIAFATPPEPIKCPCMLEKIEGRLDLLDWEQMLNVLTCGLYRRWWLSVVRRVDASNYTAACELTRSLTAGLCEAKYKASEATSKLTLERLNAATQKMRIEQLETELEERNQRLAKKWHVLGYGRKVTKDNFDQVSDEFRKTLNHGLTAAGKDPVLVSFDVAFPELEG